MDPANHRIRQEILEIIETGLSTLTPLELERALSSRLTVQKHRFRNVLRSLVSEGILAYSSRYGRSVVGVSPLNPIRITDSLSILPSGGGAAGEKNETVIEISPGAAFGSGEHPSTRLAAGAIAHVLSCAARSMAPTPATALDVGTGSGVLALAALRLGVAYARGIDIDPCARYEARQNAKRNGLSNRFTVSDTPIQGIDATFDLVIANLRTPSLVRLLPEFERITRPQGHLVFSGVKTEEAPDVEGLCATRRFCRIWCRQEKGWAGFAFQNQRIVLPSGDFA